MAVKRVLSIEIGIHKTKICEMDYLKRNPKIYNCIIFETPENTFEDGFIRDKNELAAEIRHRIADAKIKTADAVFTISSTKIANREIMIPNVKENKIQAVIDAGAQDYFPLDISEYTISYDILEKINTKEEKKYKILLLAAPINLIKNYYSFAEMLGLRVEALDYVGNSFFQLISRQVGAGINVAVQINEETTIIDIIENEVLAIQRTVPYGTTQIIQSVLGNDFFDKHTEREALELLYQENIINVQFDVARESAEAAAALEGETEAHDKLLREIYAKGEVTEALRYIVSNINRVLDYYTSKFPGKKVNNVYLCGLGARIKGMTHLFRAEVGLETKRIEKLFSVNFAKEINLPELDENELISCIGGAIKPVGFTLAEILEKKERNSSIVSVRIIFILSVFLSAVLIAISFLNLNTAKEEEERLLSLIDSKVYIEADFLKYQTIEADYNNALQLNTLSESKNSQLVLLINELEKALPNTMKVMSLSSSEESISFNVEGQTKISVAELILKLKEISLIEAVWIPSVSESEDESGWKTVSFSVNCIYRDKPAEEEGGAEQ